MQRFESSRPGRRDSNLCISKSDLLKWLNGIWAAGRRLDCKKCGTRTCNSRCGSSSPAPRAESLTTEDWAGCNSADALNCPMERRIFVERAMNSRLIIIGGILAKHPAQVRLPKYDHVVETLPSDRADQPLRVRILPRYRSAAFSASSRLFDLNGEANRVRTKQISAIITAVV